MTDPNTLPNIVHLPNIIAANAMKPLPAEAF